MSKDKNKNEGLIALDDAFIVRAKVTERLKTLATQSQKKLEGLEEALAKAKTDEEIQKAKEALWEERFNYWQIKEECHIVHEAGATLTSSLREANTIFPDTKLPSVVAEVTERRVLMDRAMGACNVLQDELQYIAESVYADKNKFTPLTLEIETLFRKIKGIRQADNRFLPKENRESKD